MSTRSPALSGELGLLPKQRVTEADFKPLLNLIIADVWDDADGTVPW